ncbi:TetR/AcrR family transcriptional regulator [Amycolatopsis australiensis]|uniref:DNA-binding transcriptional regulator, AcrR family n=1 Tax=Amycolatopsis australiensis TaxID=546364 RepID=A0A1K1RWB7_9PSEU|nr:TetR/AcrR family transcriptional regulator [Amycolatopsis australiensis]SFW76218.1 DNA-binding transcriptional regulator, AcrR family [Amycolatopsis australiensis]
MTVEDRPLRADARRNREALVAAAREVFGVKGIDAPLDEIARRAEVAIGTLYNRFPTRADLVEAAFLPVLEKARVVADEALACADPWEGFVLFLERLVRMQVTDRGFMQVCSRAFDPGSGVGKVKQDNASRIERLIARARETGALRADFRGEDLAIVFAAATATPDWRRGLAVVLEGLRSRA